MQGNCVTILTGEGVGYRVETGILGFLEGQEIELFVYTHVREQELTLYGFKTQQDLMVFEMLLSVSGVGPKSAQVMILNKGSEGILRAIKTQDVMGIKAKGIGQKTAEKVILDLKDKVSQMIGIETETQLKKVDKQVYLDVIEALSALGYRKSEIDDAIRNIDLSEYQESEILIKTLLIHLRG